MLPLILISVSIALILWYVLTLDFELGTGFTEMKKKIREGKYRVIDKKEETELLEEKNEE